METSLKDGSVIHFTNYGTDDFTGRDIYISDEFLPVKFQIHNDMSDINWTKCDLRMKLDFYLLKNFEKEFIKGLKKDSLGDIISIPSVEELFNPPYDDIFSECEKLDYKYLDSINRALGGIYWLKNRLEIQGMFCSCCSLGGQDIQVQTNFENVRVKILL